MGATSNVSRSSAGPSIDPESRSTYQASIKGRKNGQICRWKNCQRSLKEPGENAAQTLPRPRSQFPSLRLFRHCIRESSLSQPHFATRWSSKHIQDGNRDRRRSVSDLGAWFGFKFNSYRLPTSNSNLIKQKTLNSNIPPDNRIASLWQGRCPKCNSYLRDSSH